jgi:homoserine kinase
LPRIAATLNKVLKSDRPRLFARAFLFPSTSQDAMRASVTVRVPGSTSNLGAGFDCVGVAVGRWLTVTARPAAQRDSLVTIERRGTLSGLAMPAEQDLLYRGFERACQSAGCSPPPRIALTAESDIPVARGLGSSAAATVAGAAAATALLELGLDRDALAALCAALEGHPDNVAPAIYGGANLVLRDSGGGLIVTRLVIHESLTLVFAVPDFTVETKVARAVLPPTVPHVRAVEAAARSAALVHGLAHAEPRLLAAGLDDVLHVPYRRSLVRGYDDVVAAARAAGAFGATLSGSGPTILALAPVEHSAATGAAMVRAWGGIGVRAQMFHVARPAGGYEVA